METFNIVLLRPRESRDFRDYLSDLLALRTGSDAPSPPVAGG